MIKKSGITPGRRVPRGQNRVKPVYLPRGHLGESLEPSISLLGRREDEKNVEKFSSINLGVRR